MTQRRGAITMPLVIKRRWVIKMPCPGKFQKGGTETRDRAVEQKKRGILEKCPVPENSVREVTENRDRAQENYSDRPACLTLRINAII
jgi:hypothetical protein